MTKAILSMSQFEGWRGKEGGLCCLLNSIVGAFCEMGKELKRLDLPSEVRERMNVIIWTGGDGVISGLLVEVAWFSRVFSHFLVTRLSVL